MPDPPKEVFGRLRSPKPKTPWQRLLDFIEQPLFTTVVGLIGGLVALLFAAPVFLLCDVCILLALHRSKAIAGWSRRAKIVTYAGIFVVVAIGLFVLGNAVRENARTALQDLSQAILNGLGSNKPTSVSTTKDAPLIPTTKARAILPVQERYEVIDLGSLGGDQSEAHAINDRGLIVGRSYIARNQAQFRAFLWTSQLGMVNLGSLGNYSDAVAINKYGHVVGSTNTDKGGRVYFWSQNNGMRELSELGEWGGVGFDINDRDEIVGMSRSHAFLWSEALGLVDLGTLGGSTSEAHGINNLGHVVGVSRTKSGDLHGFLWVRERGMIDIGTLGGNFSAATEVNDSDNVVGASYLGSGAQHAYRWSEKLGMKDLGTLGGKNSSVSGINNQGVIVGSSEKSTTESRAFVWTASEGMFDLGTLGGSGSNAIGINELGQIVGESSTGYRTSHAVLWRPRK